MADDQARLRLRVSKLEHDHVSILVSIPLHDGLQIEFNAYLLPR